MFYLFFIVFVVVLFSSWRSAASAPLAIEHIDEENRLTHSPILSIHPAPHSPIRLSSLFRYV